MRRLWVRIGIGALAIFVVGMLAVLGFRRASAAVGDKFGDLAAMAMDDLPHELGPLSVDGARVGEIQRIRILRPTGASRRLEATLAPDDSAVGRIADCQGLSGDLDHFFGSSDSGGVSCVKDTTATPGLARFGVLYMPDAGVPVPLYAPAEQVAKFDAAKGKASEVDIRSDAGGKANITVKNAAGAEVFQLHADSSGNATIDVRDGSGKQLFHLKADSGHVNLNAGKR